MTFHSPQPAESAEVARIIERLLQTEGHNMPSGPGTNITREIRIFREAELDE
jgi:hypothetical protein